MPLIVCNFHTITCFRHLIKLLIYSRWNCNSLFFCDLNPNRLNRLTYSLTSTVALKALLNQNKTGKQTFVNKKKICKKKTITTTINLRNNKSAESVADWITRKYPVLIFMINITIFCMIKNTQNFMEVFNFLISRKMLCFVLCVKCFLTYVLILYRYICN